MTDWTISDRAATIHSTDIIERIAELEALDDRDDIEAEELATLQAFAEEAAGYAPDWQYGETLIADWAFEDYARELADDIGAIDSNAGWPLSYIDWEAAAAALQMDYTSVELAGTTYWVR